MGLAPSMTRASIVGATRSTNSPLIRAILAVHADDNPLNRANARSARQSSAFQVRWCIEPADSRQRRRKTSELHRPLSRETSKCRGNASLARLRDQERLGTPAKLGSDERPAGRRGLLRPPPHGSGTEAGAASPGPATPPDPGAATSTPPGGCRTGTGSCDHSAGRSTGGDAAPRPFRLKVTSVTFTPSRRNKRLNAVVTRTGVRLPRVRWLEHPELWSQPVRVTRIPSHPRNTAPR
jgi:hypothetical protein